MTLITWAKRMHLARSVLAAFWSSWASLLLTRISRSCSRKLMWKSFFPCSNLRLSLSSFIQLSKLVWVSQYTWLQYSKFYNHMMIGTYLSIATYFRNINYESVFTAFKVSRYRLDRSVVDHRMQQGLFFGFLYNRVTTWLWQLFLSDDKSMLSIKIPYSLLKTNRRNYKSCIFKSPLKEQLAVFC